MYLTAKDIKETYKITNQTLYNWRKNNQIEFKKLPSGKILYLPFDKQLKKRKLVSYSRVSNSKQKEDLLRQKSIIQQFVSKNGLILDEEYSDIASGMNETRVNFLKMIDECSKGNIEKIYITYKDRLIRFGFNTIENFLKIFNVEIVVINATKEEDFQHELTQDLISIIHHFSMKMYSNRRKIFKEFQEKLKQNEND